MPRYEAIAWGIALSAGVLTIIVAVDEGSAVIEPVHARPLNRRAA